MAHFLQNSRADRIPRIRQSQNPWPTVQLPEFLRLFGLRSDIHLNLPAERIPPCGLQLACRPQIKGRVSPLRTKHPIWRAISPSYQISPLADFARNPSFTWSQRKSASTSSWIFPFVLTMFPL